MVALNIHTYIHTHTHMHIHTYPFVNYHIDKHWYFQVFFYIKLLNDGPAGSKYVGIEYVSSGIPTTVYMVGLR
jgi:hypothetical protein